MVFRYALLIVLAAGSVYAVFHAGADSGQTLVMPAEPGSRLPGTALWVLAAIAALSTISLVRFMVYHVPAMLADWYHDHREWLYTLFLGGLVLVIYYWL